MDSTMEGSRMRQILNLDYGRLISMEENEFKSECSCV